MATIVEEIVAAYRECQAARDEVKSISDLYPIEGVPAESALYETAVRRLVGANTTLWSLIKRANPEEIKEAKSIVQNKPR